MRPPIVWQLDEICKGILVKDQRELVVVARPVRNLRRDVQEDLEADLDRTVSIPSCNYGSTDMLALEIMSAVSLKLVHLFIVFDFAR